jgi:uncharacterized membrane protein
MAPWQWRIGFEYPGFLALLLVIPILWWLSHKSLAGLGPYRKAIALTLRSLVALLIIAALAGVHWVWTSDRVTVIYLLDQSDSIPNAKRQLMLKFAIASAKEHRQSNRQDRAGLIAFGREASIEFPPIDDSLPPVERLESYLGKTDATNLESALKLAQASFPENSSKRIVIITDGNETLGTATSTAKRLTDEGIGIDVVPIQMSSNAEILVDKIDVPGQVRQGQSVDARVVIERYVEGDANQPIDGRLRVTRRVGNQSETIADGPVTLDRDVNVIPIPHRVDQPAGYTYEAEFTPDSPQSDSIPQNNRTTAFSYARGKGRVMVIENSDRLGEYDLLVEALRRNDIECDLRDTSNLYSSLIELQGYDSVILAGVARSVGDDASKVQSFSDEQIETLVRSVQQFGTGVLMIGGPESFGAGGWANTKLEEAMPVDFQVKNSKIDAVGALAMVMHASELAEGNYWQKSIARAALDSLGPMDYCGVVQYDSAGNNWMWGDRMGLARVGENRSLMKARLSRMQPGDMPDFDSSLGMALTSLRNVPAAMKHMIIISDGDPTPPSAGVLAGYSNAGIKISTVAVGTHGPAGSQLLQKIAQSTGGNYYVASNPKVLPKIFMREARRVARPLLFEPEGGIQPVVSFRHEAMSGIGDGIPNLRGFVLTQKKESSLVEVPMLSPLPTDAINASLLATWTYGLGRTAVFTSDAGNRWAKEWTSWPQYDQFFTQLVRWTMRPTADEGKYQLATNIRDGKIQVVVTAMDQQDRMVNFLEMAGTAIGPDLQPFPFTLKQKAPGRYEGSFDISATGAYILSIIPAAGKAPLTSGLTVPFSNEYRVRKTNRRLLEEVVGLTPVGGQSGTLSNSLEPDSLKEILAIDPYRGGLAPARSLEDVWPLAVLLGACLFFADVFIRRVALDPMAATKEFFATRKIRSSSKGDALQSKLDRLRTSKSDIASEIDRQRQSGSVSPEPMALATGADTATNSDADKVFDVTPEASAYGSVKIDAQDNTANSSEDKLSQTKLSGEQQNQSYTGRLLDAKRRAQKKKPNE